MSIRIIKKFFHIIVVFIVIQFIPIIINFTFHIGVYIGIFFKNLYFFVLK